MIKIHLSIECDDEKQIALIGQALQSIGGGQQFLASAPEPGATPKPDKAVKEKATKVLTVADQVQETKPAEETKPEAPAAEKPVEEAKSEATKSSAPAKLEYSDLRPKAVAVTKQLKEWKVLEPGKKIDAVRLEVLPESTQFADLEKKPEVWAAMWEGLDMLLTEHKPVA